VDALLKADGDGNLTKITHAEENYIAYQIGLRLSLDTTGTSNGGLKASGTGTTVGTFSDTSFDDAVGSHDGSLTTTTTTSTLKQTTGSASESGANFHKPVIFDRSATGDVVALKAANSPEFTNIVDRILLKTFANEHPGCRKLAASSPGGDWTVALSNVFTDTRTDGTSINYSIWIKTSGTAPTKVSPQKLHNDFDLKAMDEAEIQYTFGQRAKTRISITGIGTYKLLASGQSLPAGTWVAKGTATDTKQQTADQNYTRVSTGNFVGNYAGRYVGDYVGNYSGDYTRNSSGNYTRVSTTDFTGDFIANYVGNYAGTRPANPGGQGQYTRNSLAYFTATEGGQDCVVTYTGNYDGASSDPLQNFERNSTSNSTTVFAATEGGADCVLTFTGDFIGNYDGTYDGVSTRDSQRNYTNVFTGNFTGNYEGAYLGNYVGAYTRNSLGNYDGAYTRDSTNNFTGNYAGETIQASSSTIDTYTLYVRTA